MEIYVGNLAYATTDDGLKAAFAAFGEVTAVRVVTDRVTGRSKGFGFVTMPDSAQSQQGIRLRYDARFRTGAGRDRCVERP